MITYQREQVSDVIEDIKPLLVMHWAELAHFGDIKLDPDWEFYRRNPSVRVYTARDGGTLIGYGAFFVAPNRHYRQSIQAVQDIFFVDPLYRGTRVGYRLLKFCEEQAKAEGAQAIYHHVKTAHAQVFAPLLGHLNYEPVDLIYAKRLDKE
jgi:GNAT superfamily N-acetyltransferase